MSRFFSDGGSKLGDALLSRKSTLGPSAASGGQPIDNADRDKTSQALAGQGHPAGKASSSTAISLSMPSSSNLFPVSTTSANSLPSSSAPDAHPTPTSPVLVKQPHPSSESSNPAPQALSASPLSSFLKRPKSGAGDRLPRLSIAQDYTSFFLGRSSHTPPTSSTSTESNKAAEPPKRHAHARQSTSACQDGLQSAASTPRAHDTSNNHSSVPAVYAVAPAARMSQNEPESPTPSTPSSLSVPTSAQMAFSPSRASRDAGTPSRSYVSEAGTMSSMSSHQPGRTSMSTLGSTGTSSFSGHITDTPTPAPLAPLQTRHSKRMSKSQEEVANVAYMLTTGKLKGSPSKMTTGGSSKSWNRTYHQHDYSTYPLPPTSPSPRFPTQSANSLAASGLAPGSANTSIGMNEVRSSSARLKTADGDSRKSDKQRKAPNPVTTAPGYQRGDPNSNSWSFFSRANVHSSLVHSHSSAAVPYGLPYDREMLNCEWARLQALKSHAAMLPWSEGERKQFLGFRPKKILDIGCGPAASWIVEAAQVWTNADFVGLDIAPVLLPLHKLPYGNRLSFIQANFLDKWPFPNDSFDFVRLAFLGHAMPEAAWIDVYDEANRVLKPQTGLIQCIEVVTPFKNFASVATSTDVSARPSMDPAGNSDNSTMPDLLSVGLDSQDDGAASGEAAAYSALEQVSSRLSADSAATSVTAAQAAMFDRALRSFGEKCNKRMISVYPVSIFPAAFILTCHNELSEGPTRLDGGLPNSASNTTASDFESAQDAVRLCIYRDAIARISSSAAGVTYEAKNSSTESLGMRDYIEHEQSWSVIENTLKHAAGISQLVSERLGWNCKADEVIESALLKQVEALDSEKSKLQSQAIGPVDEHRSMENYRALRDAKADLQATQRRLHRPESGHADVAPYKVIFEFVMKAGRKM